MPPVSQILRQAREAKGISLEEVAQRTYIKPPYLAALEEGDVSKLPAPVYVHGYIRQYAKLLGLNGTELVLQYQQDASRPQSPAKLVLSPSGRHSNFSEGDAVDMVDSLRAQAFPERSELPEPMGGGDRPIIPAPDPEPRLPAVEPRIASPVEPPLVERTMAEPRMTAQLPTSAEVQSAKQQAHQIIASAQREAHELRVASERYADQVLAQLESEVGRALQTVRNGRAFLQSRRRKQQEV